MLRNLFLILFPLVSLAQTHTIDSLKLALKNAKHDTTRCYILNAMIEAEIDASVCSTYNEQLKSLVESNFKAITSKHSLYTFYKKQLASVFNNTGCFLYAQGDTHKALDYLNRGLRIREEIGDQSGIARSLTNMGSIYDSQGDLPKAIEYFSRSLKIQEKSGDKSGIAHNFNNVGILYQRQGNIQKALEYLIKSLKIRQTIGNKADVASTLCNIGVIYYNQGNIPQALNYYNSSLKIQEEIGDKSGIAYSLNNIGMIYKTQGDIHKALEYWSRSLNFYEEIREKTGIAELLSNIGGVYEHQGNFTKALSCYERSLQFREEAGEASGITYSLSDIGWFYFVYGDPLVTSSKEDAVNAGIPKALKYFNRSLKIAEETGNKADMTYPLNCLGAIYVKLANIEKASANRNKNFNKAIKYYNKCMGLSKELGYPTNIKSAAKPLSQIYKSTGNYKLALENYELYIQMRDSINNEATRKASIKSQLKYEYEKQAAADSVAHAKESEIKNAELAKQSAEIKAKKNQQYALFGGLFCVCVFGVFMFNRYKVTQKQKSIIEEQKLHVEEQKKLVEEKQKEILDSIQYARRIQMAQIPSEKRVEGVLKRLRN